MIGEGCSSYKEISSGQSSLNRSGLSLFHKTQNNCTVKHQCKTDTRGIRPARFVPYSKKINLIRPWHCVIALGPAGLFITFSQTQHFWSTCQSVAKMLLALDLCCQGHEGLLPSAHAFVLGMQFPLSAHKVWVFFYCFYICLSGVEKLVQTLTHANQKYLLFILYLQNHYWLLQLPSMLWFGFNFVSSHSSHMATLCWTVASIPDG